MDFFEKLEEIVGELLCDFLVIFDIYLGYVVDKMWWILNDFGMINFVEEIVEVSNFIM